MIGSCEAVDGDPEDAAGVATPEGGICVVAGVGVPEPAGGVAVLVVLLVQPATRITARQTMVRKTIAFFFDI